MIQKTINSAKITFDPFVLLFKYHVKKACNELSNSSRCWCHFHCLVLVSLDVDVTSIVAVTFILGSSRGTTTCSLIGGMTAESTGQFVL